MPTNDNSETIYISSLALLKVRFPFRFCTVSPRTLTEVRRCLAVSQMLKHGRAGVPLEVMGLMLGDFVDEFTVRVIGQWAVSSSPSRNRTCSRQLPRPQDVFAMPQSGTGVSVEAVDPVFQTKMIDMLKQTGR